MRPCPLIKQAILYSLGVTIVHSVAYFGTRLTPYFEKVDTSYNRKNYLLFLISDSKNMFYDNIQTFHTLPTYKKNIKLICCMLKLKRCATNHHRKEYKM